MKFSLAAVDAEGKVTAALVLTLLACWLISEWSNRKRKP